MKALTSLVPILVFACVLGGCSYSAVSAVGPDKVVVTRDDDFLFGATRTVYVCKVTDGGVRGCQEATSP